VADARVLAFYLPQFHPVPINDRSWGAGFTEWTNVAKARPLFHGHEQPHLPGELGFYDLRVPETRQAQADLARQSGIEGFIYWHYWFAGQRLLERPFNEVLKSGEPDFPFCLAWANQSWTGVWHGAGDRILVEQTYPGPHDYRAHFAALRPALEDDRYITVDSRPLLIVYRPTELPEPHQLIDEWRTAADQAGLPGLHLVGVDLADEFGDPRQMGFDAAIAIRLSRMYTLTDRYPFVRARWVLNRHPGLKRFDPWPRRPLGIFRYSDVTDLLMPPAESDPCIYPCIIPNWDNTPRSGPEGTVLTHSTPVEFQRHVADAVRFVGERPKEHQIIAVKSWNEWAEGNYLEPDARWGRGYLQALATALNANDSSAR
jgi:lipopolysaccharide biosynthesis protein